MQLGFSLFLFLLTTATAFETLLHGTEVASMCRYLLASLYRFGYTVALDCQYLALFGCFAPILPLSPFLTFTITHLTLQIVTLSLHSHIHISETTITKILLLSNQSMFRWTLSIYKHWVIPVQNQCYLHLGSHVTMLAKLTFQYVQRRCWQCC